MGSAAVSALRKRLRTGARAPALGQGDFEEAYRHAARSARRHARDELPHTLWVALDLVESAFRSDRRRLAHVEAMRSADVDGCLRASHCFPGVVGTRCSAGRSVECLRGRAGSAGSVRDGPYVRASSCSTASICAGRGGQGGAVYLLEAEDTFRRLGAEPWMKRAAQECEPVASPALRCSGAREALTPQEFEIATLAASGLTNKDIAQKLYMSHRTSAVL